MPPFFAVVPQNRQPWPNLARAALIYPIGALIYFSVMMLQIDTRFQSGSLNMLPTP